MDALICGAPTWHTGADEQRSGTAWDEFLYDRLPSLDLSGKKVAIFGLGDQGSYGDNFCDAAGELYDCFSAQGATMVGLTATDDYDYSDSKALRDGKFCGLLCDEDNEYDKSEGRANDWVEQLKGEGVAFKTLDQKKVFVAAGADAVLALALIMADDVHKGFVVVGGGAGAG